jgi:hypothetical protein
MPPVAVVSLAAKMPSSSPVDEKLCFVIMPFRQPFDRHYEKIIQPAITAAGLIPLRGDKIYGTQPIIRDIWKNIRRSRIIVADVSGRNPNVNYELGLAHALGKCTVIISCKLRDIPFDYRHLRCILYDSSTRAGAEKLFTDLTNNIRAALEEKTHGDNLMWAPDAVGIGGGISIPELMARERTGPGGDLNAESEVVVHTPQPIEEVQKEVADQVYDNLIAGVKYVYIVDFDSRDVIAGLVSNLVRPPNSKNGDLESISARLSVMQGRLRIYVVKKRWPFRFCSHNARDVVKARLYLQDDDGYTWIEWLKGSSACEAAKQLREIVRLGDKGRNGCIRGVTPVFGEAECDALWDDIAYRTDIGKSPDDLMALKTLSFG